MKKLGYVLAAALILAALLFAAYIDATTGPRKPLHIGPTPTEFTSP